MPTAVITGITGQDGSYLAELLLEAGYRVVGLCRRLSADNHWRVEHLLDRIELVRADLLDLTSLVTVLERVNPDEIYNLAAQSFVAESWSQPIYTAEVTALGAARLLEAVRLRCPKARVYQASSSEMFGLSNETWQDESTPFHPRSPYGAAKTYAHHLAINYRESYGIFVACGILFNHESPRRSLEFVTRRISDGVARIATGTATRLTLGNMEARRDWGYAGDYVVAMHRILQTAEPSEFVIATGETHSVREFAERAFRAVGLVADDYISADPALLRPADIRCLRGDAGRARRELGWEPTVRFPEIVDRMVEADLARQHARRSR